MKRKLFVFLAKTNKLLLPSLLRTDPNHLTKSQKMLLAYRYWVTTRSLT